jgi:hypothetical protein
MSWALGVAAYLAIGAFFGASAWRRRERSGHAASIALATLLWPLWAPFVLEGPRLDRSSRPSRDGLDAAIEAARSASREAAMDAVFSDTMAARIAEDVAKARVRIEALESALAAQEARATDLGSATSALCTRNTERLARLLADERLQLVELGELLEALRSQLVLARFAGSSEADVSGIVREVWSRVEGLGAVIAREDDVLVTSTTSAERIR